MNVGQQVQHAAPGTCSAAFRPTILSRTFQKDRSLVPENTWTNWPVFYRMWSICTRTLATCLTLSLPMWRTAIQLYIRYTIPGRSVTYCCRAGIAMRMVHALNAPLSEAQNATHCSGIIFFGLDALSKRYIAVCPRTPRSCVSAIGCAAALPKPN